MIVFTRELFGTENHLAYNGGYQWIDEIPDDAWSYGNSNHPFSVEEWLYMYNVDLTPLVEKKYIRMAEVLGLKNRPWQQLLGESFSKYHENGNI